MSTFIRQNDRETEGSDHKEHTETMKNKNMQHAV